MYSIGQNIPKHIIKDFYRTFIDPVLKIFFSFKTVKIYIA